MTTKIGYYPNVISTTVKGRLYSDKAIPAFERANFGKGITVNEEITLYLSSVNVSFSPSGLYIVDFEIIVSGPPNYDEIKKAIEDFVGEESVGSMKLDFTSERSYNEEVVYQGGYEIPKEYTQQLLDLFAEKKPKEKKFGGARAYWGEEDEKNITPYGVSPLAEALKGLGPEFQRLQNEFAKAGIKMGEAAKPLKDMAVAVGTKAKVTIGGKEILGIGDWKMSGFINDADFEDSLEEAKPKEMIRKLTGRRRFDFED